MTRNTDYKSALSLYKAWLHTSYFHQRKPIKMQCATCREWVDIQDLEFRKHDMQILGVVFDQTVNFRNHLYCFDCAKKLESASAAR